MTKMALITSTPCREGVIEFLNSLNVDFVVGLGDIECPQYISNYYGILGEMDTVTAQKYLRKMNKLIVSPFLNVFSTDFSSKIVITHFPPDSPTGSRFVKAKILAESPEIVIHGHTRVQKEYSIGRTRVISVGSMELGYYVIFNTQDSRVELERTSH